MAHRIPPLKRKQKSWHGLDRKRMYQAVRRLRRSLDKPKKRKAKKFPIIRIAAIPWDSLEHEGLFPDTFDSFSYGDAEWTLVFPQQIIDELGDYADDDNEMAPLIRELKRVPKGVYIAFSS